MARTKIKHRTYNVGTRQQTENVSKETDMMPAEEPAQDATTLPDVTETEEEDDLPNAFLDTKTVKGQGDAAHSQVEDVPDTRHTGTTPKPRENGLDLSPKPQENGLDLSPKPQENGLDMSPKPQENVLDMSLKPQDNGLHISPKPHDNVLDMLPKHQEHGLDMNDDSLESILGCDQESTSISQAQPSGLADIDTHISRDSPLNLAWDSSMKENYQPQANNPNFRPITPEFPQIPVDEILSPTIQKEITKTIRTLFPNGPPPPPPVRPMRRPKKGDVPYIVGCRKRPRVPSPTSLTVFKGDPYGITNNSNIQEDEEQCSPAKRGRRGPNGSASLSKSRFNPQSNEIAERLKLHEKIDRLLGRTPKEEPVSYMSKPRSFSPLPSTSTDNETIMKNDKYFSESLNCDDFEIDDDDDLPEVILNTNKYKQEKGSKHMPLAILKNVNEDNKTHTDNIFTKINEDNKMGTDNIFTKINEDNKMGTDNVFTKINEDNKTGTDNILTEINEDMNNNNDIICMDDDFREIEFDKYLPKEKILDYSDVEVVKPKQVSDEDTSSRVRCSANYNEVICVDDASNRASNLNPVSQAPLNSGTSVLRASNNIATPTETNQSDLVIEVPDVLAPRNMSCQASTSRLPVWNEDVQFVSEVKTSEKPRDENIENVANVQIVTQGPSSSQSTIRVAPDLSLHFLMLGMLEEYYGRRNVRSQSRRKSKRQKENQDTTLVNNENTAPSVNQSLPANSATQPGSTSPGKRLGECPICLENLPTGSIASTNCGHVFCLECIKQSLATTGKSCPTCRKKLRGVGYHQVFL